ncbi:DAK2 domain-containing protein [Clostridium akagii]|uniref:DAK2 domain-containing protein n=1 Tax=Clostridium akagii TaxID=91623 RepID=UPI00047D9D14|nr:DAK2 domain-containing protein [Clostridium akagii]
MEHLNIDGHRFYNMIVNACNELESKKNFVNSLNVFPVPDGDTGTNMSMTFRGAISEISGMQDKSVGEISKKLSKGALMSARGNSGVILSQILRGIAKGMENLETADASQMANSLLEGSKAAYKAVMRPTEGTILTIIKAAGESASRSMESDIDKLMEQVCSYSEEVLKKTPEMLPVLKKANVVDAGGAGLLIILKGMTAALKSNLEVTLKTKSEEKVINVSARGIETSDIKFGYCTEFFIKAKVDDISAFKNQLVQLGDSLIVVNIDDIVKVHVHTNDPGLILSKALKLGELSKIKIDNMKEQHRHILDDEDLLHEEAIINKEAEHEEIVHKKYAFIAVAAGEGLVQIFKDLGADYVIEGGQTMNPSTQDILSSINKLDAENVYVLPNNKNIIMAASQASELSEKNVIVIPTKTIPQGITCLTEFNSNIQVKENTENITKAFSKVATGSVTYAVRDTEMDGEKISAGDILGLVENKIRKVGKNVYDVCEGIIKDMVKDDSELISIYYGEGSSEEEVKNLVSKIESQYPDMDVQCNNGQQPLYYFIVSVE